MKEKSKFSTGGRPPFGDGIRPTVSTTYDPKVLKALKQKVKEKGTSLGLVVEEACRSYYLIG